MSARLDAVLAMIDGQAEDSLRKLDQAQEFAERTEALRVEGTGGDGVVTVAVNATGHVVDVEFARDHHTRSAADLAAAVLAAQAQAQRRLSARVAEVGEEVYGPDSPTVRRYADAYREQYGSEDGAR